MCRRNVLMHTFIFHSFYCLGSLGCRIHVTLIFKNVLNPSRLERKRTVWRNRVPVTGIQDKLASQHGCFQQLFWGQQVPGLWRFCISVVKLFSLWSVSRKQHKATAGKQSLEEVLAVRPEGRQSCNLSRPVRSKS